MRTLVEVTPMAEPLIPMTRAAAELGVPYQSFRRLVHLKRIPSVRFAGIRRVRLSAVRAALEEIGVE